MRRGEIIMLMSVTLAVISGCGQSLPSSEPKVDVAGLDPSVAPGDDFFAYANGGWLKSTAIPADKSSYGVWTILTDVTRKRTVDLIQESAGEKSHPGGDAEKVGDFYSSFMDEAAIESKGIAPIKPQLDAIAALADAHALARAIGGSLRADVDPLNSTNFQTPNLFGIWIAQALDDPEHNVPYLLQGGLGMPDREYYLSATPHMTQVREQYRGHIAAMLKLAAESAGARLVQRLRCSRLERCAGIDRVAS
jgi:putative endopeptidase